jgi:Protein of unknown function, DUF547
MNHTSFGGSVSVDIKTESGSILNHRRQMAGIDSSLIKLSQEIMYAARLGEQTDSLLQVIAALDEQNLQIALDTDEKKMAFWINMYNGFTQVLLKADSNLYKKRGEFFRKKAINIGGHFYSLDDIEHGILRRSSVKWSGGYFNNIFPGAKEKAERVQRKDYRIHFALNCGAKSCPPIAFYEPENLNRQLTLAERAYLSAEVVYDSTANKLYLPAIMGWFRKDFGGKKGMIKIVKRLGIISEEVKPAIQFKSYDWTLYLNHYQ